MYVGSRTHCLAAAGYSTIFKGKMLGWNIRVCIWYKMKRPLPLSCDTSEICTSTHVQKTANRISRNGFLKNTFVVPIQILGKSYWQRNQYSIVCTCTTYGRNRVCRMGSALFSCHSSLLRWQEYEAIYVQVRAHYPLSGKKGCIWTLPNTDILSRNNLPITITYSGALSRYSPGFYRL